MDQGIRMAINISAKSIDDLIFIDEFIAEVKQSGLSPTDFELEHSSLSYLRNIEADILKIDMFYIRNMLHDSKNMAIVKTIISTAQIFGMKTLAEGVEDEETANELKILGCDYAQGYFFSYPLTISEFEEKWIKQNRTSRGNLNNR
jgi:EAL domain-containing protein (putative c-di-GMP-specific phosphodiesterase class I)